MGIERYVEIIKFIDSQIRKKGTGTPKMLAQRMEISEWSIYNYIKQMKSLGAPIVYSDVFQSYIYTDECTFLVGFFDRNSLQKNKLQI